MWEVAASADEGRGVWVKVENRTIRYGLGLRKKPTDGRFGVGVKTRSEMGLVDTWLELGNERTNERYITRQNKHKRKRNEMVGRLDGTRFCIGICLNR